MPKKSKCGEFILVSWASRTKLTLNQLLEFATLKHLGHDVRAADKFTVDVELGNGWPVGVLLDALTNAFIVKNIDGMQIVGATSPQDVNCIS